MNGLWFDIIAEIIVVFIGLSLDFRLVINIKRRRSFAWRRFVLLFASLVILVFIFGFLCGVVKGWFDCLDWILRSMCCSIGVVTTLLLLEESKI